MIKRAIVCVTLAALLAADLDCYGSFAATRRLYKWNGGLHNKWASSVVFWGFLIVPVYGVCAFVDMVAFNLIEFWSGKNPMSVQSDSETHKTVSCNGKTYEATMGKGKITIVETKGPDAGKSVRLTYKKDEAAWYLSDGGADRMVASFEPAPLERVRLYYPDGSVVSKNVNDVTQRP